MLNDDDDGEEFCKAFDVYIEETRAGDLVWSISDESAFAVKSRECHADKQLAVRSNAPRSRLNAWSSPQFTHPLSGHN